MNRYVCIHGHFYQPPRENPWLEDVELQDEAYPYHDWNEKITEQCYRPNAASRILGADKKIVDIINNYSKISFDFGPTLLSWLERHAFEVYQSVIEADRKSRELFSGHGAAIAQAYNHIIMPLANARDKRTQVIWGIGDFERRFGRKPEGMWLPETAVDLETLDILAEHGIKFTILAPHQAKRIRRVGSEQWNYVASDRLDTTNPYLCRLNSGRAINLFFYNAAVASGVVDGHLLENGEVFARRLADVLAQNPREAQLAHIATDGETYGHHYRHTDMALAYCLDYLEANNLAKITIYGEYLEKFPPGYEVEINENTSWSCTHGVERWRSNCGCCYDRSASGFQQWREPLREALDWLRDQLEPVYESQMSRYVGNPWEVRDEYVWVINDRSAENLENFLLRFTERELSDDEKITLLKLLEIQRNALLIYTSCGWFFDHISGIETLQIMQYASRAIQLGKEVNGEDFESAFMNILQKAPANAKKFTNGREVYRRLVKPVSIDLNRVGAHLALSSIFEQYPKRGNIYCYLADIETYDRTEVGQQTLAVGRAAIKSKVVLEKHLFDFAVLHFGGYNLIGAVGTRMSDKGFCQAQETLKNAFIKSDTAEVMRLINAFFGKNIYTIWHLFRDEQRRILNKLLEPTWQQIETSFRHIYEHNCPVMQIMQGMNMPLPKAFCTPAEFIINQQLCRLIRDDQADLAELQELVKDAAKLSLHLDGATLEFEATNRINRFMGRFANAPGDVNLLKTTEEIVRNLTNVVSDVNLEKAQNVFFAVNKEKYADMRRKAESGVETAKEWVEHFKNLSEQLGIEIKSH